MNDTYIRVRLSSSDKEHLQLMAAYYHTSCSDIIRKMIMISYDGMLDDMYTHMTEVEASRTSN